MYKNGKLKKENDTQKMLGKKDNSQKEKLFFKIVNNFFDKYFFI